MFKIFAKTYLGFMILVYVTWWLYSIYTILIGTAKIGEYITVIAGLLVLSYIIGDRLKVV